MKTLHSNSNGATATRDAREIVNAAARTTWRIDPAATRAEFTIRKRLMFIRRLTVTGRFSDVSGTITLDEQNPTGAEATVSIGAASIDTGIARRDKHLRTADFFHVERHPALTFMSRRVEAVDQAAGAYRVSGDLTVRGVTRPVSLDARYTPAPSGEREPRLTLDLTAPLNRRDFGIVWNKPFLDIADDLTVSLHVEATPIQD